MAAAAGIATMVLAPIAQAAPVGDDAWGASLAGRAFSSGPPAVRKVSPKKGPAAGGSSVLITGTNFDEVSAVKFGSVDAARFEVTPRHAIIAVSPAEPAGRVDVTVTTPGGTSAPSGNGHFIFIPAVTSVSPNAGPTAGGTEVTVGGSGFAPGSSFKFGPKPAKTLSCPTETMCTLVAPAQAEGFVDVIATVNRVRSLHAPPGDRFRYLSPPTVSAVTPNEGPETGGTSVTITGTHFTQVGAVKFGTSSAASVTVNSASSIAAVSPPGTGAVDVSVTTPGGTSAATAADHLIYRPRPTVTEVSPTEGPEGGATTVTITGTNFTGATSVKFGASAAASVTVNSASSITATSPPGSGTVDVTVTTAGGTSGTGPADKFTYVPPPLVTELTPNTGPEAGGTSVVINGNNFLGATAVKFGSMSATTFTVNSASMITAVSPAGTGTVDVTVTTVGGTSATGAGDRFSYIL